MTEQNGNGTAALPAQAAALPVTTGTGTTQAAAPQIDPGEFQRLQRIEQEYRGNRPLIEAATKHKFKAEDFAAWAPVREKYKDPQALVRAYDGDPQETEQPLTRSQLADFWKEERAKEAYESAEKSHWSTFDADQANFADDKVEAIVGKDAPKALKALVKSALMGDYHTSRTDYEDGHPLHGKFPKPLGNEWFGTRAGTYKAHAEELKKHFQAATLAGIGDAANKQPVSTPAGTPGAGGSPSPNNNKRPGGLPSTADVQAAHDKIRARRGSA